MIEKSATILIFDKVSEDETRKFNLPCYTADGEFPRLINIRRMDPVLLDLVTVARITTPIRLRFLFYFQVLEYCSYYYLNDDLKRRLIVVLKRPDLINNPEEYSKYITEEFKDYFKQNDDSTKLEKLVLDHCEVADIQLELASNLEYFMKVTEFDGGFKIDPLLADKNVLTSPSKNLLKSIKGNIEKIRNVLVHVRESRENKVILPTKRNNDLLLPYFYIVQRLAEKIAIQYE